MLGEKAKLQNHIQARFTRYLCEAFQNKKTSFWEKVDVYYEHEIQLDESANFQKVKREIFEDEYFSLQLENEQLSRVLESLKPKERQVLILRCIQDLPFQQIADRFHLSYKGTAAIYYRAISKIRKRMEVK